MAKRKESERKDLQHIGHAHHRNLLHHVPRRRKHLHNEKRQIISAVIDGQEVSWENNYVGLSSTSEVEVTATIDGVVVSWANNYHPEKTAVPQPASVASASVNNAGLFPSPQWR